MKLEPEINELIESKLNPKTVSFDEMLFGMRNDEPLLCILNDVLKYCKAFLKRYEYPIGKSYFESKQIQCILDSVGELLNCQGGVALDRGASRDSKDNSIMYNIIEFIKVKHEITENNS